jgi:GNAT superfamily N-acetyltransferase
VMTRYLAGTHDPQGALAPRAAWLALAADATLVGYAAGHQTTRFAAEAELQWLLVAPAARGHGVGDALLAAFAAWCSAVGARRVLVNVAPENTPARRLYARHGAEPLAGHEAHWMVWPRLSAAAGMAPTRAG